MEQSQILQTVLAIAREVFDDDQVIFSLDTAFKSIEEWDSLSHMHMVVRIEKAFDVRFRGNELNSLVLMRDLVDIISAKLSG